MIKRYLILQDGLSEIVGRAVSLLLIAMLVVMLYEILMRYFLMSPTIWAHELTTMLFGAFCVLSGCYTLRHQGHVRSEVLWGVLPPRLRAGLDVVVYFLGIIVLIVFFKMAIDFAAKSWANNEFSNRSVWQPPLYYIKTVIPIAVGLLILQSVAELVRSLLVVFGHGYLDPRVQLQEIPDSLDPLADVEDDAYNSRDH
jgi:TRAP-type mannitol/chloroaromatic compound transport system permease small subunit